MASPMPRGTGPQPRLGLSCGEGMGTQGMISPTDPPFVEPATGTLSPVSFRFLFSTFQAVCYLEQRVAKLESVLAAGQFSASRTTAAPPVQSSGGAILLGVGVNFTAPAGNSRCFIAIDGQLGCNTAGGTGMAMISWGTGPLPPAGAPPGQLLAQLISYQSPGANAQVPFSESAILPGLVAGTQYWVDLVGAAQGGGSYITAVDLNVFGLVDPGA